MDISNGHNIMSYFIN